MRSFLVLLTMAPLGAGACGGAGKGAGSDVHAATGAVAAGGRTSMATRYAGRIGGYLRGDDDADETNHRDADDRRVRGYGRAADATDRQAAMTLVARYYAAAAAGDGAGACSLMSSRLAGASKLGEAAEEAYPPAPSAPPLHGEGCPRIMAQLFEADHRQLAADSATLTVTGVRLKDGHGLALLGFKAMPEREIRIRREDGAWKIDALLDEELP